MALFSVLSTVGSLSILVGVVVWLLEMPDRADDRQNRQKQKEYQAWTMLNLARGTPVDRGRTIALEDLAAANVNMVGIDLSGIDVHTINLRRARMARANLSGAKLNFASFSGAMLSGTDFKGANLWGVNFRDAYLSEADFRNSELAIVNFAGAYLDQANFQGVSLDGAFFGATFCETDGATMYRARLGKASFLGGKIGPNVLEGLLCQTTMPDGTVNNRDCKPNSTSEYVEPKGISCSHAVVGPGMVTGLSLMEKFGVYRRFSTSDLRDGDGWFELPLVGRFAFPTPVRPFWKWPN